MIDQSPSKLRSALSKPHIQVLVCVIVLSVAAIGTLTYRRISAMPEATGSGMGRSLEYGRSMSSLSEMTRDRLLAIEVKAAITSAKLRDDEADLAKPLAATAQMASDISQLPEDVPPPMRSRLSTATTKARVALHGGDRPAAIAAFEEVVRTLRSPG